MSEQADVVLKKDGYKSFVMTVATAVLISTALAVAMVTYALGSLRDQQPVTVDIQKIVVEEITASSHQVLDEKTRQERGTAFAKALEQALDEAALYGKRPVIVGAAMLRGATDVTAQVQASVKQKMGG